MTKTVRIENADMNQSVKVLVEVWDKGYPEGTPDNLVREIVLANPTDMCGDVYLTDTRYLVVKEVPVKVLTEADAAADLAGEPRPS